MERLHADEVAIGLPLVERLLAEQHPQLADRPLRLPPSQGTDNVVVRLGDDLSVRLPRKESAVPSLLTELEWLPQLAPHLPLPVPVPVARGEPTVEYPFPWAICEWVDGTSPDQPQDLDPQNTAHRLGRFVRALHRIDTEDGPVASADTQRAGSLGEFDEVAREALLEVVALMAAGRVERDLFDPAVAQGLWEAATDAPGWNGVGVWVHRDLHVGNLLAAGRRLTGVIDFGGLVVGDPAGDVMAGWHVLPSEHRGAFLRTVEADADTQLRARAWVLLQGLLALPYYLDSHRGIVRMARHAITAALDSGPAESS